MIDFTQMNETLTENETELFLQFIESEFQYMQDRDIPDPELIEVE